MASLDASSSNILKCPFCLKAYTTPRLLTRCLHTFCEKCIRSFSTQRVTASNNQSSQRSFECPVCKVPYHGPDNIKNVTQWLASLPLNYFMTSNDATGSGSSLACEPCSFRGTYTKATLFCTICKESQCKGCADVHTSSRATKTHQFVEVDEATDIKGMADLDTLFVCEEHNGKAIEYHCIEHNKFVCSACAVKEHRACSTLKEVPTTVDDEIVKRQTTKTVQEHLEQIVNSYDVLHSMNQTKLIQFDEDVATFRKSLVSMRSKINKAFDMYETKCESKLSMARQLQKEQQQSLQQNMERHTAAAESCSVMFDTIVKQGNPYQKYLIRYYIDRQIKQQEQALEILMSSQVSQEIKHNFHTLSEKRIDVGTFEVTPISYNIDLAALKRLVAGRKQENSSDSFNSF